MLTGDAIANAKCKQIALRFNLWRFESVACRDTRFCVSVLTHRRESPGSDGTWVIIPGVEFGDET